MRSSSTSGQLYLGYSSSSSGTYNLSAGSLSAPTETLGYSGSGSFTQSGGAHAVAGILYFGYNAGGSGTYCLGGSGLLSAPYEYVGLYGSGSFTQSGGSNSLSNLYLGVNTGSGGTYNLSGSGLLSATTEVIGFSGSGNFTQSGGTHSISGNLYFAYLDGSSGTYSLSAGGLLATPSEYIGYSGSGSFTQSGGTHSAGSLLLAQNAASAGTYNLNGGSLAVSGLAQGAGSAAFNFGGGTLGAVAPWTSSVNLNMSGIGGPGTVDATGGNISLSGVLSGSGGLTKVGAGMLTVSGSNQYSGATTVSGGTLQIGPSGSISAASAISVSNSSTLAVTASTNLPGNTITVNPGGIFDTTGASSFSLRSGNLLTAGRPIGAGTDINGNLTLGGGTLNIGGSGIAATLTEAGGLTLGGGALMFDLSSTGASDLAKVTNLNLSSATVVNINMLGGSLSNGTYSLINYSGNISGSLSTLMFNGVAEGASRQTFSLLTTGPSAGALALQVSAAPAALTWTGQQNGQWDLSTLNWSNAGTADKFYQGDAVTFSDTASTAVVTLNTSVQPGSMLVNNNLLNYTFSGSGGISGGGSLTKNGSGALVVSLSNTYTGGTTINAGLLQAGNNSALGANTAAMAVNGGTLDVHGYDLNVGPLTGTGTIDNLSGNGALTVGNGDVSSTFSGTMQNTSGQLSLIKVGSGSLGLSGNIALAGTATVSGGAINQSGGYLQSAAVFVNGGAYSLSGAASLSTSTEFVGYSGAGVFTQSGGTNTLSKVLYLGANAGSSGAYNLVGGVLVVPNISQGHGSSSLNITGGILTGLGNGVTLSLPIVLTSSGSNGTFDTSSSSLNVASQISGSGGLTKTGSATLVLSGNNTYSGDTTVSQGAVQLANSNAAQNTTVAVAVNNGLLFSSGGTFNVGAIGGNGSLSLADTGANPVTLVAGGNNASTTYGGVISGPGVLVHDGTGTLALTASNTFSGGAVLGGGTLASVYALPGYYLLQSSSTLQATGPTFAINNVLIYPNVTATIDTNSFSVPVSGVISGSGNLNKAGLGTLVLANSNTYTGGTSISQGALELASAVAVQNSTVSVNVNNGVQFSPGIGAFDVGGLSGSNSLTLNDTSGSAVALAVGGNNADTTYSGSIGGNGGLVKSGSGSLTLTGTNSYTGGMIIDPGTVSITSDAALGAVPGSPSINITFSGSSTLQAGGSFALSASRNILLCQSATGTFDTNGNTLVIGGLISGSGGLAVVGSGTLVLTNSETFTGGTTIGAGTLQLGNGSATGGLSGNIVNNGLLVFDRSDSAASFSGAISGSGSVQQAGSGTLLLGGTNTFTGTTTVSAGILKLGNATALQDSTVVLSGGLLNVNGFSATLGGLAGTGNLALGGGSLTVGGNGNTTTYAGSLSAGIALVKTGSGMLALTGSNSYSGGTTLNQGILSIASDAALGAVPGTPSTNITFAADSSLQAGNSFALSASRNIAIGASTTATFDTHGNTLTIGGLIGGPGGLAVVGGGTLVLTNSETFTGGTTISAAALQLGNGGATGWVNGNIVNNGLLVFDRSDSAAVFSAAISGSGSVQMIGSGTLLFGGTNTFTGTTILSAGMLELGNATALQNSTVVPSGGTLNLNSFNATLGSLGGSGSLSLTNGTLTVGGNGNSTTFAGTLVGLANLIKTGSGLFVLDGANNYAGLTTINAGTLEAATTGSIPGLFTPNQVSVAAGGLLAVGVGGPQQWTTANITALLQVTSLFGSGGTLGIDTSAGNFTETGLSGSGLGMVKLGPNTLTLTGTNSYSGGTFVSGGALEATTISALPGVFTPGKVNVAGGAALILAVGGSQPWTTANVNSLLAITGLFSPGASLGLDTNGGSFSFGSTGSSSAGLTVIGSNCLTLTGSNSFSGVTTINQGTLQLANSAALANSTVAINADNGLQFSPGLGRCNLGGLSGGNLLALSDMAGGAVGLVVGSNGASTTFSGQIGGDGSLTKTGAGNLVLSGSDSYTGGTNVDAGTLYVTNSSALPDGTNLTVGPGGTFVFDPSVGGAPAANHDSVAASRGAVAVPEPGTLVLLAAAIWSAAIYCRFRRPRHRIRPA